MNLKKALSYIAFGFLFTLVNVNITMDDASINIVPNFVGWILFFLAMYPLGSYAEGKGYLKWLALLLAGVGCVTWFASILSPELDLSGWNMIPNLLAAFYMFVLFGILEKIARDYSSPLESRIHTLKILNLALYLGLVGLGLLSTMGKGMELLAMVIVLVGITALIAAIVTCVTLFKLRNEIRQKTADLETY